ncbi:MAG: acyl-CoA carboxylase biotin carboxyl carrier protein subunit [Planctomycetota bacterium]
MSEHRYQVDERTLAVRINPQPGGDFAVAIEEDEAARVQIVERKGTRWTLALEGRRVAGHVVRDSEGAVLVAHRGRVYRLPSPESKRARRGADEAGGLTASMPSVVVALKAEVGARVSEGEVLLVLEAMKMTHEIKAPFEGTLRAFHCEPGGLIEPGVALVTLDRIEENSGG